VAVFKYICNYLSEFFCHIKSLCECFESISGSGSVLSLIGSYLVSCCCLESRATLREFVVIKSLLLIVLHQFLVLLCVCRCFESFCRSFELLCVFMTTFD